MLMYPSANRVYSGSALRLGCRELEIFGATTLDGRIRDVTPDSIAEVPYITFHGDELSAADLCALANVSSRYALFEVTGDLLRPITVHGRDRFDSDLVTVQKYHGKTNEQFTKLLFNLTALATDHPGALATGDMRVLDPMCGRGTTLNQALRYGCDAWGIELNRRDVDEYAKFLKTWLRTNRLKHTVELGPVRRNKKVLGQKLEATVGVTKEDFKAGEVITVGCVNADTTSAGEFFRNGSFDLVVTDAPYGVQHGSTAGRGSQSRDPLSLLGEALPVWHGLLRRGGAIGVSWNTNVTRRADLVELLERHGFAVADSAAHEDLAHRVDQAITRDVAVARKP